MQTRTPWRKSSYSGQNNACVEIAGLTHGAAVRDSKNPTSGYIVITAQQWTAFINAVKAGQHDLT
ncbi:MAG TPA: DUF397 domain-containing protein [Pseudonocardiaceae bacterium]|mgnify:CR=1 FL=1